MCLNKERGRGGSLISHHSPFGVLAWHLYMGGGAVRVRLGGQGSDCAGWTRRGLLASLSAQIQDAAKGVASCGTAAAGGGRLQTRQRN